MNPSSELKVNELGGRPSNLLADSPVSLDLALLENHLENCFISCRISSQMLKANTEMDAHNCQEKLFVDTLAHRVFWW